MTNSILNAAAAAAVANGALLLGILGGAAYIGSCEIRAKDIGDCDGQWLTGLSFMGIGGAAKGAWSVGFNTDNPNIPHSNASEKAPTSPGRGPSPSVQGILRKKAEDAIAGAAEDQVRALLSRGGR